MTGAICWVLLALQVPGGEPNADSEAVRFFETQVRPVLAEHCFRCHGATKQWAGLRLDSRSALLKGGDSGPAVSPGKPAESLLIRAVKHLEPAPAMPQDGRLTDRQIADLEKWVAGGAVFPAGTAGAPERTRDPRHWAFQPPQAPATPSVEAADWSRTPIDRFVQRGLEAIQAKPADPAPREALLRRTTFDLTGLPPTPDQREAFLQDEGPDAYERLVDRLLADPAYGQRWGRHWLDVARYADSNGLDENIAQGNAWRYRDYVVDSFNHDKPFDRFVIEQLAGDLWATEETAERHERLIATGFLSIGPKVLAEVDVPKMQMDIVDEQLSTVGRVFLGLTLGCARCHDHKFDPIDATDYYALAGIFKSTRTMDDYRKVAKWHEEVLATDATRATQAAYDMALAEKKRAVEAFVAEADRRARESLAPGAPVPEKLDTLYPEATKTALAKLREELATLEKNPPDLPSAMSVAEDKTVDLAVHVRGSTLKLGEVVPRRVPPVVRGPAAPSFDATQSGRLQLARWLVDPAHPLTPRVTVNRIWRWHFGKGLVRSADNFGLLGERPTHPELLDWLALRFVRDDWSLKSLHRLLVTSAVYRQSTTPAPGATELDPDNSRWSRFEVRRLEAEAARDALLAVSERLDRKFGGPVLQVKNRGYLFDHTSIDKTDYSSLRRSLYLPVIRNNVYDVFQLFDFADPAVPTGDRATTTVPPQALWMLNGDFVMDSADALAERLQTAFLDDDARLQALYRTVFGREPTEAELAADRRFLAAVASSQPGTGQPGTAEETEAGRRRRAWLALCQVAFASNEFLYLP